MRDEEGVTERAITNLEGKAGRFHWLSEGGKTEARLSPAEAGGEVLQENHSYGGRELKKG